MGRVRACVHQPREGYPGGAESSLLSVSSSDILASNISAGLAMGDWKKTVCVLLVDWAVCV